MLRTILFLVACTLGASTGLHAQSATAPPDAAAARLATFRAFAGNFVGEWSCEIKEFDGNSDTPVWSDTQRRVFTLTMARHVLEERALLKSRSGQQYEGGLHLITFDPNADRITQHGFWLPTQADRLFFIEGYIDGRNYEGQMTIRLNEGGEATRPYRIRWRSDDEWTIEVDGRRSDGTTYLREVLVYTRDGPATE